MRRTCVFCGKTYSFCPSCPKDANKPKYLFCFCTEKCKIGFQTLSDYGHKLISKEDAKAILTPYVFDFGDYSKSSQQLFAEIYKEDLAENVTTSLIENIEEEEINMI